MQKTRGRFIMRLILPAILAGCVILTGSAGAVAAEGLENRSNAPVSTSETGNDRSSSCEAAVDIVHLTCGAEGCRPVITIHLSFGASQGSRPAKRAEIFGDNPPTGMGVPAPGSPDSSLFPAL